MVRLLDQQEAALSVAVLRVDGGIEPRALDEPGAKILVHIENEDKVRAFEIAADRRVVPGAGAEDQGAIEMTT